MRERPILFSGPMVQAILEGRKTQTRRLVNARGFHDFEGDQDNDGWPLAPAKSTGCLARLPATYGTAGDRLWVRETWGGDILCGFAYRADHPDWPCFQGDGEQADSPWRPSIHMPKEASRLTLEVTGVRVEPLQSISERDACAEGMGSPITRDCKVPQFAALWDAINGERAPWASNPWVWVIEFRRLG
jgi:hypothetical protein